MKNLFPSTLLVLLCGCASTKQTEDDSSQPSEETGDTDVTDSSDTTDTSNPEDPLSGEWQLGADTVTVNIEENNGLRSYQLTSTHLQRDNGPSERQFSEQSGDPILRSGNPLTDALFAMAIHESRENSVGQLQDGMFQSPQDCDCFETGELWNWVWTRDIAYATELGLGWLDTERAKNSLLFKLSESKTGGTLQIVQDTGTGGSWPVSTDRVTWARGAMSVLQHTSDSDFKDTVIRAMRNTAEVDRLHVYDARDGLYFGESSFLDWREQSYPNWVENNPVQIAMSKSLSTNLNHLYLLQSLESLTGENHNSQDLATAIDAHFWTGEYYSSYITAELNPVPVQRQDLLSTALAVIDLGTHPEALQQYPHSTKGAPVIFPEQQLTPIYHNRAIWPFVSSYAILAAKISENGAVFDANLDSIITSAALNLSHMENIEWQTGNNWVEDDVYSGPIVNSRRQLWSVAGFIGAITHGVFGLQKENGNWTDNPVLPSNWFSENATLTIDGTTFQIGTARLGDGSITIVDESDWMNLYGAATPMVSLSGSADDVTLEFYSEEAAQFDVYRDGGLVAENATSPWRDTAPTTACYAVVAKLTHASQPSAPTCWWGDDYQRIQTYPISDFMVTGGTFSNTHGRPHYDNWGEPDHQMETTITADYTGEHYIQLVYGNGSNTVDTGITSAVKMVSIRDSNGLAVASDTVVMPQLGNWDIWGDSSLVPVTLTAGETYTLTIVDGWNMSYLAHYNDFVDNGGGDSPYNYVNITEMKLLFMR